MRKQQKKRKTVSSIETTRYGSFYISNGDLYCQGDHRSGLLGHQKAQISQFPLLVIIPQKQRIEGITCSHVHTMCWSESGKVFSWGKNSHCVLGIQNNLTRKNEHIYKPQEVAILQDTRIVLVVLTNTSSMVLTIRGKVYYWGRPFNTKNSITLDYPKELDFNQKLMPQDPNGATPFIVMVKAVDHHWAFSDIKGSLYTMGSK